MNLFDIMELADNAAHSLDGDPLDQYLASPTEPCPDPIQYWSARKTSSPGLARMGLDYATIPGTSLCLHFLLVDSCSCLATSVDVERTFSKGRLCLSHVRGRLSSQTTRALLCVGEWSRLDLIKPADLKSGEAVAPELDGDEEYEMEEGWERVKKALGAR